MWACVSSHPMHPMQIVRTLYTLCKPYAPYAPCARQVAALEALVWRTLDQLGDLAQRAGRSRSPLPPPLLALRPPPPPAAAAAANLAAESGAGGRRLEASPAGASSGAADGERGVPEPQPRDGGRGGAEASGGPGSEAHWVEPGAAGGAAGEAYPALRRAQRLAYQLASLLVDSFDVAEGRQARPGGRCTVEGPRGRDEQAGGNWARACCCACTAAMRP